MILLQTSTTFATMDLTTQVNNTIYNSTVCDVDVNYRDIPKIVIAAVTFVLGILCLSIGYRFYRALFFVTGLILATVILYLICIQELHFSEGVSLIIGIFTGVVLGLICSLVPQTGFFLIGCINGLVCGLLGLICADQVVELPNRWIAVGVLLGCAFVIGCVNVRYTRSLTILGSSCLGAMLIIAGVDFFVESFRLVLYTWSRVLSLPPYGFECWQTGAVLAAFPITVALGVLIQACGTARGIVHKPKPLCRSRCCRDHPEKAGSLHRLGGGPGESERLVVRSSSASHLMGGGSGSLRPGGSLLRGGMAGGTGTASRTRPSSALMDPEVDKHCQLYRIRQIHGDVPSQSAFKSFQLRHSGVFAEDSSMETDA